MININKIIGTGLATIAVVVAWLAFAATGPEGEARPGATAPDFTASTTDGRELSLTDFSGRKIVLEWSNHQCPYVRKHYETGNMQALQKSLTGDGTVWLTIISSASGMQGYVTDQQANDLTKSRGASPTAVIRDPEGTIGRLYGATATPHMFVIDELGTVAYMGAIDDQPGTQHETVDHAHNYVLSTIRALDAGKKVADPYTKAYGCSVKYRS